MKNQNRSLALLAYPLLATLFVLAGCPIPTNGGPALSWTARILPSTQWWSSVTYGNGVFVAVASSQQCGSDLA